MMDAFDEIDLGGEVRGVRTVPMERILGDNPVDNAPKPQKEWNSRNVCDVFNWDEKTYTLTLSVSPRLSRKILSDCIAEQQLIKRIDRVRVYVRRHPFMNLPIHVLHHCGFHRAGIELCWERSLVPVKSEPAPVAKVELKQESWDAWGEELASLRALQETCRKDRVIFKQSQLDRIALLEQMISDDEENRKQVQASPEYRALEDQQRAIQAELDKMTGKP
jgi:hypothetical protein